MGRIPQILALGGGGFSMEAGNPLVDDFALEITGCDRPRVCFVPTASGDADHYVVRFYRRFAAVADCSHLSLFRRDKGAGAVEGDIERHLLAQDLIYVGGGSVISLLGRGRPTASTGSSQARGARAPGSAGSARARCAGLPRR